MHIIEYNGEFCEKRNEAVVVLKGTEETFAAVEREITTEKSVRQRNYTYIIVLLVVEFK